MCATGSEERVDLHSVGYAIEMAFRFAVLAGHTHTANSIAAAYRLEISPGMHSFIQHQLEVLAPEGHSSMVELLLCLDVKSFVPSSCWIVPPQLRFQRPAIISDRRLISDGESIMYENRLSPTTKTR